MYTCVHVHNVNIYNFLQSMAFRKEIGADTILDDYDPPEVCTYTVYISCILCMYLYSVNHIVSTVHRS